MPFASMTAAVSEIASMFATDWAALTPALNGDVAIPLLWEGDPQDEPPPAAGPWARVAIRHDDAEQVSFGAQGARRYTRYGRIIAEINCPLRMGVQLAESMAIMRCLRGARFTEWGLVPQGPCENHRANRVPVSHQHDSLV